MNTLVIQSAGTPAHQWLQLCMQSVSAWSAARGWDYRFIGDEIFSLVPRWYLDKAGQKKQVATDFARLLLLQQALEEEKYEQAIWIDADMLILDQNFNPEIAGSCAFGQEIWIQPDSRGRLRGKTNVHNALCIFRQGSPVLPFLIHCVESLMRRVDENFLVPQFVGPKLLNALHPLADFQLVPAAGALSPAVVADVLEGGRTALDLLRTLSPEPLQAVNLCASLLEDGQALRLTRKLLSQADILTSQTGQQISKISG